MLKKKALQIVVSGALLTSLIASPFTINMQRLTSHATANEKVYSEPIDKLVFISSNDLASKIEHIKGAKKDETLDKLKDKVKKNALKVKSVKLLGKLDKKNKDLVESTDIAANIEDVRKDADLQAYLQNTLVEGKKVYLYGELSIAEYKELLNVDEIKLKTKDPNGKEGYLTFGAAPEEVKEEKGELKQNAPVADSVSNIIGYSMNGNEKRQFVDISVSSYNDEGALIENKEEFYIQDIMAEQADMVDMEESENPKVTALISVSEATAADNPIVTQAYGAYSLAKSSSGTVMGRVDMDWELLQEPAASDNSSYWDYFTLTPLTQANAYNGTKATIIWQDIDIPYDSDELRNWTPQGDNTTNSFELSMGFPFNFGTTMTFSDATKVDDQSSTGYDYARWNVTDDSLDDEVFKGAAGWASAGKRAISSYAAKVTVRTYSGVAYTTAAKRLSIDYSY